MLGRRRRLLLGLERSVKQCLRFSDTHIYHLIQIRWSYSTLTSDHLKPPPIIIEETILETNMDQVTRLGSNSLREVCYLQLQYASSDALYPNPHRRS